MCMLTDLGRRVDQEPTKIPQMGDAPSGRYALEDGILRNPSTNERRTREDLSVSQRTAQGTQAKVADG